MIHYYLPSITLLTIISVTTPSAAYMRVSLSIPIISANSRIFIANFVNKFSFLARRLVFRVLLDYSQLIPSLLKSWN